MKKVYFLSLTFSLCRSISLIILFAGTFSISFAQNANPDNQLKYIDILPPSPAVASIANFSRPDIGMVSGTAQLNVPLTTFSIPGFGMPISLNYSSNGVKVDEIASRVGTGWQLDAGGVITRTVQGTGSDEKTVHRLPASTSLSDRDFENFLEDVTQSGGYSGSPDSEPDIFNYSFAGISGKFILDDGNTSPDVSGGIQNRNNIVQITKTNVKIERDFSNSDYTFKITDANGNIFYFGGNGFYEESKKSSTCGKSYESQYQTTAWFLKRIELYNGDLITFEYSAELYYRYDMGVNQTVNYASPSQIALTTPCACPDMNSGGVSTCVNYNEVKTRVLMRINSNARIIEFTTRERSDVADRLLEKVVVKSATGIVEEEYRLYYEEVYSTLFPPSGLAIFSDTRYRPFLTQVAKQSYPALTGAIPLYRFSYHKPEELPVRLSFAQDHWGYFNGKNNTKLIPKPNDETLKSQYPSATANREADETYAAKGLLTKIVYPTGGYDDIEYEANSNWETRTVYPTESDDVYDQLYLLNYNKGGVEQLVRTFTIGFQQTVSVSVSSTKDNGRTVTPDDFGKIRIAASGNHVNLDVDTGPYPDGQYASQDVVLPAGTYNVYLTAAGDHNTTRSTITFIAGTPTNVTKNWPIGGMRVKSVTSFAQTGSLSQIKKYKYGASISTQDQSVAVLRYNPIYFKSINYNFQCAGTCSQRSCSYGSMFSSSLTNLFSASGTPVAYPTVFEMIEDAIGNNIGVIEHKFHVVSDDYGSVVCGSNSVLGGTQTNWSVLLHGKESVTTTYSRNGSSYVPVQRVSQYYKSKSEKLDVITGFIVNRLFNPCIVGAPTSPPTPNEFDPYEATRYAIISPWVVLDSTVTETFDREQVGRVLKIRTAYAYDDFTSLQPTTISTINSLGAAEVVTNYYTSTTAALQSRPVGELQYGGQIAKVEQVAARNKFDLVFQEKKSGGVFSAGYEVDYDYFSNTYYPQVVKEFVNKTTPARGFTIQTRDNKGNITQRVNDSEVTESYIWGYAQQFPIAKVYGAALADIAFTSFEDGTYGNWVAPINGTITTTKVVTGNKALKLTQGSIYKSGLSATTRYHVSLWISDDSDIDVVGGSNPITMTGPNGWTHYFYTITNATTITISGTGTIDAIRLYPEGAQMTTLTFEPLIGVTTLTDTNDAIMFFEYDGYGRLKLARDTQGRILQAYEYHEKLTSATDNAGVAPNE